IGTCHTGRTWHGCAPIDVDAHVAHRLQSDAAGGVAVRAIDRAVGRVRSVEITARVGVLEHVGVVLLGPVVPATGAGHQDDEGDEEGGDSERVHEHSGHPGACSVMVKPGDVHVHRPCVTEVWRHTRRLSLDLRPHHTTLPWLTIYAFPPPGPLCARRLEELTIWIVRSSHLLHISLAIICT